MTSLGNVLMASAIGQGAGNFVHGQMQGAFDRQRFDQNEATNAQTAKVWDYQNDQMDRTLQQQGIEDTAVTGSEEEQFQKLADLAGTPGPDGRPIRGDLQRKYQGLATKAREAAKQKNIASAATATLYGSPKAVDLWNNSGLYEGNTLVGIAPKRLDDGSQDPNGDFIFSVKDPTTGQIHPLEIPRGMMALGASDPAQIPVILERAQQHVVQNNIKQQNADTAQNRVDNQAKHWEDQDNHWQRQDANALKRAQAAGGGGAGRLTDQRWRYQWALSQVGKPDGFKSEREAMAWAQDPNRGNKDYWQSMRLAGQIGTASGYDADTMGKSMEIIKTLVDRLHGSPIAGPGAPAPTPASAPQAIDFKAAGFTQDPKSGNWKNPRTGVWFKKGPDGKPLAWSNNKGGWVSVQ